MLRSSIVMGSYWEFCSFHNYPTDYFKEKWITQLHIIHSITSLAVYLSTELSAHYISVTVSYSYLKSHRCVDIDKSNNSWWCCAEAVYTSTLYSFIACSIYSVTYMPLVRASCKPGYTYKMPDAALKLFILLVLAGFSEGKLISSDIFMYCNCTNNNNENN